MSRFVDFCRLIANSPLNPWLDTLPAQLSEWENNVLHGKFTNWYHIVEKLPTMTPSYLDLLHCVSADSNPPLSKGHQAEIESLLRQLMPWRKGPFSLYGITIDTEWRSDWKWERMLPHIAPLAGRLILDVGCNNGYYLHRMVGAGAQLVVGIDPMQLFYCQFTAVSKLLGCYSQAHMLPLSIEQLPKLAAFDTVFSMGLLYHRRSPLDHLLQLKNQLVRGGELVLETLVIDEKQHQVLVPGKRYAKMRNVYFIPSPSTLTVWLGKCGFINVRQVNVSVTSTDEQRSTTWMTSESLADFLHPDYPQLTIEGYPAPMRAVIVAEKS